MEVLLVLVIMTVLMAITLPSFQKIAKGQGIEYATRSLTAKLNMTRSYAISSRQYVAILFPQFGGTPAGGTFPVKYINSAYRPCIVERNSVNNNYYFKCWVRNEGWEFLPEGVAVLETDEDDGVNTSSGKLHPANGTISRVSPSPLPVTSPNNGVNCSDIGGGVSLTDFPAIIFKPTGALSGGNDKYIELGEAVYSPGLTDLIMTNKESLSYSSIAINRYTGRVYCQNK